MLLYILFVTILYLNYYIYVILYLKLDVKFSKNVYFKYVNIYKYF